MLDNILKLPSESDVNAIQAEIPGNEVHDVNQFKTADNFLGNVAINDVNHCNVADYIPPKNIEIAKEVKDKTRDKKDSKSSSPNSNHVKISMDAINSVGSCDTS